MKVRIYIDKVQALKAGRDQYGFHTVDIPAASLTQEQKEVLERCAEKPQEQERPGFDADFYLDAYSNFPFKGEYNCDYPYHIVLVALMDPTVESVMTAIKGIASIDAQHAVEVTAKKAEEKKKREQEIEALLASPAENYVVVDQYNEFFNIVDGNRIATKKYKDCGLVYTNDERVQSYREQVLALVQQRNEQAKKEQAGKVAIAQKTFESRQAVAKAQEAAEEEQIDKWIMSNGTESQKKKYKEGFLPAKEVTDAMREQAFEPLKNFKRYDKINHSEVCSCDYDENCKLECEVEDLNELREVEYDWMCKVREAIPEAIVTPRLHVCTTSECNESMTRKSLHVQMKVGAFTFSREYSL